MGVVWIGSLSSCSVSTPVTGFDSESKERDFDQSETALTTAYSNGQNIVVATYNDGTDTGSTILYTATTRKTLPGASMMGWSFSLDNGHTWKYGGKVLPPKDWAALWGDPALTTSRTAYNVVFMSNLAIPSSKMPAAGIDGPVNSFLGGACIARSTDGGRHFQVHQMVTNQQHFYDGGSMAASKNGEIYAGFVDVDANRIDVWRAPNDGSQFTLMPNPFGDRKIYSHPRLRTNPFDGSVYVAAQGADYVLYMTRWTRGAWAPAVQASDGPVELYPEFKFASGTLLRSGPQFSFDVGASSTDDGSDAIRVLYTQRDPKTQRTFVIGSFCKPDLSNFQAAKEWGTTPGNLNTPGDQFNPNVRAWQGFIGLPPVWKATYMNRDPLAADKLDLKQGNLAYVSNGTRIFVPFSAIRGIPVCPDLRGYWGDYDDLEMIGFADGAAQFLRTVSDSTMGCQRRWEYTSHHVHISEATFQ